MGSGLATLAAIAVLAMLLVTPSLGHKRKGPLCSDCASLCNANCTAAVTATCTAACLVGSNPDRASRCQGCEAWFRHTWCADCCNNGCPAAGCDPPCNCDNCTGQIIAMACRYSCREDDRRACDNCVGTVRPQCQADCTSACNSSCVKKGSAC